MHIVAHFFWLWLKWQFSFRNLSSVLLVCLTYVLSRGQCGSWVVFHTVVLKPFAVLILVSFMHWLPIDLLKTSYADLENPFL